MAVKSNADLNDEAAAAWAARLDRRGLTGAEKAQLDAWLAGDDRRNGALVRAQAALVMLDCLQGAKVAGRAAPRAHRAMINRRMLLGGGLAAAAVVGGVIFVREQQRLQTFTTGSGEIRRLAFPGGTEVVLDARSRIRADIARGRQMVSLDAGRAAFDLQRGPVTPLTVEAGVLRLQATGAAFSAAREADTVDLLVSEGSVQAWAADQEPAGALRLDKGSEARLIRASLIEQTVLSADALARAEAWKIGRLALDGESVAEATAIFNRHNQQKIIILSPELERQPLVGYFHLNDPGGFAAALETSFDVRVRQTTGRILIE